MTLSLVHREYSHRANEEQGIPYAYQTYCEHYLGRCSILLSNN